MTTHERAAARLDDFAGGELPLREAQEVAAHVEECAECRAELDGIRALLAAAAELPRGIAPPRDLWAGIAARIEPGGSGQAPGGEADADDPRVIPLFRRAARIPRWLMNAAAAVLVAVASSALTMGWMARQERAETVAAAGNTARQPSIPASLVAYAPAEAEYRKAVGDLEMILATRRDRLAPATVATLERNLRIIDEAIRQSRDALAADPANAELATMLSHAYEAKVETLRRVVAL